MHHLCLRGTGRQGQGFARRLWPSLSCLPSSFWVAHRPGPYFWPATLPGCSSGPLLFFLKSLGDLLIVSGDPRACPEDTFGYGGVRGTSGGEGH